MNAPTLIVIIAVVAIVLLLFIRNMRDKRALRPDQTGDIVEETKTEQETNEERT